MTRARVGRKAAGVACLTATNAPTTNTAIDGSHGLDCSRYANKKWDVRSMLCRISGKIFSVATAVFAAAIPSQTLAALDAFIQVQAPYVLGAA